MIITERISRCIVHRGAKTYACTFPRNINFGELVHTMFTIIPIELSDDFMERSRVTFEEVVYLFILSLKRPEKIEKYTFCERLPVGLYMYIL